MRELILQFDRWLFVKINNQWTNTFFDTFFPFWTNIHKHAFFIPIVLALFATWIFWQRQRAIQALTAVLIVVPLTDLASYKILKANFDRLRPHYTDIGAIVKVPYAPTSKSFPSNHALNSAALANTLYYYYPALGIAMYINALVMGYSRIYVGIHYPLDVFAGMLFGVILAIVIRRFFLLRFAWFRKGEKK